MPATTSTRAPGTAGALKRSARITPSPATPTTAVVAWMSPSEPIQEANSLHALEPSVDVPVNLESSPITTSTAAPARNPVITAFERETARSTPSAAARARETAGPWRSRSPRPTPRPDRPPVPRPRRHRRRRRPGTNSARGDLARRAEERVDDRARGCRIQPVLQRHAGDPRVAEVLGHDQRCHRDRGRDIASQPATVVRRQPADDRQDHGRQQLQHLPTTAAAPATDDVSGAHRER